MAGAGPAFGTDSSGKGWIYVTSANGALDLNTGGSDAGDSLLKLNPNGLAIAAPTGGYGYFTPVDQAYRGNDIKCSSPNGNDVDFGSAGPMLIPDNQLTNWPYLAVTGDKEGGLWFVNRTNPGGYDTACQDNCNCTPAKAGSNIQTYWTGTAYRGATIHGGAAFWEFDTVYPFLDWMYAAAGGGQLIGYPLCADPHASNPIDPTTCARSPVGSTDTHGAAINFNYGTTPSVTANGQATDAVVWTIKKPDGVNPEGTTPGVLYAFDAVSMQELYDSNMCAADGIAPAAKFSVPTIANGHAYIGTQALQNGVNNGTGTFYIFGPLSRSC